MSARVGVTSSPHWQRDRGVAWIMRQVVIALVPATVLHVALFGFGIVVQLAFGITAAVAFEVLALRLRGVAWRSAIDDGSVVVLAWLLCFAIPPYAPWWVVVAGAGFAVLLAKHAFGGLGHNVFNPAMAGYLFVLLCFPATVNQWPDVTRLTDYPGPLDSLYFVVAQPEPMIDALSGATVLDYVKTQAALMQMASEMDSAAVFGVIAGNGWEWISFACLLGGVWLLWRRVITWRLPAAYLVGLGIAAAVGYAIDPELHRGVLFHWFAGGAMMAAFFIVTDPVSSSTTPRGMLVFGAGAGVLTYLMRETGVYPDGVAFAVVTMNAFAPLIDRVTQPRLYGKT